MADARVARVGVLLRHLTYRTRDMRVMTRPMSSVSAAAQRVLDTRKQINILDSHMSYLDTGSGDKAVVFLHGNPTSSYLWRNIIPHVQPIARCLAPDLIGMGQSGKEPNNSYRFVDHYKYLCTWFNSVNLPAKVTIVCHDWGSGLGFHWCHENPDRVEAIVHMESIVSTVPSWDRFPEVARNVFQALRSEAGEEMVLKQNFFVERLFPGSVMRQLTDEEMEVYRAPFKEPGESRRPTLTWPREIPVESDGPADVVKLTNAYRDWLSTTRIPKLYLHAEPGFFSRGVKLVCQDWPNQKTVNVKGLHFVQEDSPDEIGKAIKEFLQGLY